MVHFVTVQCAIKEIDTLSNLSTLSYPVPCLCSTTTDRPTAQHSLLLWIFTFYSIFTKSWLCVLRISPGVCNSRVHFS